MNVIVEADGGSRGNPRPAGYGAVVLDAVRFGWVPRSRSARADALANRAMDAQAGAR